MAYLCLSSGFRGNSGLCMGETGDKDGGKTEKEDKGNGNKL